MTTRHAPRHLQGLPTLTEVIEPPPPEIAFRAAVGAAQFQGEPPAAQGAAAAQLLDDAELLARMQLDVQRHVELMLEQRVREAIEPVLARVGEDLVRELRTGLASTLHDAVARSVNQELARRRNR